MVKICRAPPSPVSERLDLLLSLKILIWQMSYQMLSLKRFGLVISNNFNKYKQYHVRAHAYTQTNTRLEM